MLEGGACEGMDPDIFFPEMGGNTGRAKRICKTCPIRIECLNYAIRHHERWGVWGGMSPRERLRLVRNARRDLGWLKLG